MNQIGFRTKMVITALGIMALTSFVLIGLSVISTRQALISQLSDQLTGQGVAARSNIERSSDKWFDYMSQLGDSRLIEGMFITYEGGFYGAGFAPGKDQSIFTKQYEDLNKTFLERVQRLQQSFDFSDVFLVNSQAQVLFVAAATKENSEKTPLGKNLQKGVLAGSLLAKCYDEAKKSTKPVFSKFGVSTLSGEVEAFLCIPKQAEFAYLADGIKKGDYLGVIVGRINLDILSKIVSPKEGMGETGIGYLVNADGALRTSIDKVTKKVTHVEAVGGNLKVESVAIESAAKGDSKVTQGADPFGFEVLSYSTPLKLFTEDFKFVLEKEMSEVMAPVQKMMMLMIGLGIGLFVVVALAAFWQLTKMIKPLDDITNQTVACAEKVTAVSSVLASASSQMNEGTVGAASSIEETVASLEEISAMVNRNSQNAEETYRLSVKNLEDASKGNQQLTELIQTMKRVAEQAKQIAEITTVIDDIAFQTNLLALNAAVEAARAGEQGRGFAVVAEAVRALAQKSAQSAKEISELIKNTVEIAAHGESQADQSGQALEKILASIEQTSHLTQAISEASKEQSNGIKEVTVAMSRIDQVTQNNAQSATRMQTSAEEMQDLSNVLHRVSNEMNQFTGHA